jgi:hypothetical protein
VRAFIAVGAAAAILSAAACKDTTRIETKEAPPAAQPAPTESGSGVDVRTGNDTIHADSTGVRVKVNTDSM